MDTSRRSFLKFNQGAVVTRTQLPNGRQLSILKDDRVGFVKGRGGVAGYGVLEAHNRADDRCNDCPSVSTTSRQMVPRDTISLR